MMVMMKIFALHSPLVLNGDGSDTIRIIVDDVQMLMMLACFVEMDTTEKSGGMSFDVLLKPATADSPQIVKTGTPTDRRISLELIDKKLRDAQGRREVRELCGFLPSAWVVGN